MSITVIEDNMNDNALVTASKATDCPKGAEVSMRQHREVCVMQGYSVGGTMTSTGTFGMRKDIDKKNFPKLKKGLFSSTYKNVTVYFLYNGGFRLRFKDSVTTKKGRKGYYDFGLTVQCTGFDTKAFATMLKSIKYTSESEKTVISLQTVHDILGDAIKDAMQTILDDAPQGYDMGSGGFGPGASMSTIVSSMEHDMESKKQRDKTNPLLFGFLKERMRKIGLVCLMEI